MPNRACIMGCPALGHPKYPFPWDRNRSRRKMWFQQFSLDPAIYTQKYLYACRRHFSSFMTMGRNLRPTAYPDVNLSPFNPKVPYMEKYSYYDNGFSPPDARYHDNVGKKEEEFVQTSLTEIQYAPVTYQLPMNTHTNNSSGVNKNVQAGNANATNQQPAFRMDSKRQCILKCPGRHSLHRIPLAETDLELRKKWLYLLGKDPALYTKTELYVCDLHFNEHMMCLKRLVRGGYPNKNLPPPLRKPVPEAWENQTECIQKCTDYTRKYPFPSYGKENTSRQMWLKQFNRVPELYKYSYIYACDRHFAARHRVGPYLHPEAIPELNLPPSTSNPKGVQANYISKKWSLQKLEALTKADTTETPDLPPTENTNFHTTPQLPQDTPQQQQSLLRSSQKPEQQSLLRSAQQRNQQSLLRSSTQPIQLSLLGPSQNASQQPIQFSVVQTPQNTTSQEPIKISLLCPPRYATQSVQLSHSNQPPNTSSESLKLTSIRPKEDEILKRLNMIKMKHMGANSSRGEDYVKIQTLGVFVPQRSGHFVAMDKVLSAIDPLDTTQYAPLDWVEPIEPQLSIKTHPLPKELYETTDEELSEEESEVAASPTHIEYSDEDTKEVEQICGKRKNENVINYGNTKIMKITNTQDRIEDAEVQYKADDPIVVDTILDQLTAAFPKDSKKYSIVLTKNNTVIECRKQPVIIRQPLNNNRPQVVTKVLEKPKKILTPNNKPLIVNNVLLNPKNILTPNNKPQVATKALENPKNVIASNNKPQVATKVLENPKNIITPSNKPQVTTKDLENPKNVVAPNNKPQVLEIPVKTVTRNNKTASGDEIDFEDMIVGQQIQKSEEYMREKASMLRKAVVSAESWQQVMSAIKEASLNTPIVNGTENDESDQIDEKVRNMVEQIKQACERDKQQSIDSAKISKKVSVPLKSGQKILKIIPNVVPVIDKPTVATANTIENSKNPNGIIIKSVEVIKPANVTDKRSNVECVANLKVNAEPITKLPMKNVKIATVAVPKKLPIATSNRPTVTKTSILPPAVNLNHHHNIIEDDEFENTSIEDLLAKAKHLINECDTKTVNNAELLLDNTTLLEDDEILDDDEATEEPTQHTPHPPSCILKCVDFETLHAFPPAETSTYRRHFWFMQLGLNISIDWLKSLYICNRHFDENMLLADNTLKEFAYPCKELKPQSNSFRVDRAAQTQSSGGQYKLKLLAELAKLRSLNQRQNIELNRIKVLIRLKQEAARLVAEIKTAKETIAE